MARCEMVQGRATSDLVTGSWVPEAHWCTWKARDNPSGPIPQKSYCKTKWMQAATDMSEHTVHHSLLHSIRLVRVTMLTPAHHRKVLRWACECENWTMEQWNKVAWSDVSRFFLLNVDSLVQSFSALLYVVNEILCLRQYIFPFRNHHHYFTRY